MPTLAKGVPERGRHEGGMVVAVASGVKRRFETGTTRKDGAFPRSAGGRFVETIASLAD
jgi:hypothetical protein